MAIIREVNVIDRWIYEGYEESSKIEREIDWEL